MTPSPRTRLIVPAMLLAVLALCYLPMLTATFGYADDFAQLAESINSIKWLQRAWNEAARPIGGWLTEWSFHAAGTIAGLAYLRAAGLLLLLLIALVIYRHLLPLLRDPALAGLAAAFICAQPPFLVNVGWASMWLYLIPPLLSYAAYLAILRGGKWLLPALLLLYIALNIYPVSTMFLWFWFGTEVLLADTPPKLLLRRFMLLLVVCGAASVLYYGLYKAFGYHHARGEFVTDLRTKLDWFIRIAVGMASRLNWFDCWSRWLPLSVWSVIVLGAFLLRKEPLANVALKSGLCAALLFLCYLPLLVVKELDAPYRSQIVLTAYIAMLAFVAVLGILVRLNAPARIRYLVLGALVAAGLVKAEASVAFNVVFRQSLDYRYLRAALTRELPSHQHIVLICGVPEPNCWNELCRVTSELGTTYPVLYSMAVLVARESWNGQGPDPAYKLHVVPYGTAVPPSQDTAIVDMEAATDILNLK